MNDKTKDKGTMPVKEAYNIAHHNRPIMENDSEYSSLIDHLPGVVYQCRNDQRWSLSYISAQVIALTGYSPDTFYKASSGIHLDPIIHPDDRPMALEKIQIALTKKIPYELYYRILTAKGKEKWVLEKGVGVYSNKGNLLFVEGFIMDNKTQIEGDESAFKKEMKIREKLEEQVQQRTKELNTLAHKLKESNAQLKEQVKVTKTAEAKALSSQSLFSAIAKNFPKGTIAVLDRDSKFVFVAGEEVKEMGLDKFVYKGVSFDDIKIFSEKQSQKIKEYIDKTLSGEQCTFEMSVNEGNYMINTSPLFDENKNVVQALFVNSNISGQKQVELKIKDALKKEQELNELKSRFVSMASHEFRTPLSTILSSATLISKHNDPGKEENREKYVRNIKLNVRNLVGILEDFLSLGKLEERKTMVLPTEFDLVGFTKSLLEEFATDKKKVQVIKLTTDQSEIYVLMDKKLVRNILTNLLSNAIKYSSENYEIWLHIGQQDDSIEIKVTDHGIGIPEEEQAKLFERFFRARNATNIKGTGLGMYIVKKYVDLMEGTIGFTSVLEKGTTFTLRLPIKQKESEKDITY